MAGCGPERLSSLPVQAPDREVAATASLAAIAPPSSEAAVPPARGGAPPPPPRPPDPPVVESTPPPSPTSSCWDAYRVDLTGDELDLPTPSCFQPGGVLRLEGV